MRGKLKTVCARNVVAEMTETAGKSSQLVLEVEEASTKTGREPDLSTTMAATVVDRVATTAQERGCTMVLDTVVAEVVKAGDLEVSAHEAKEHDCLSGSCTAPLC